MGELWLQRYPERSVPSPPGLTYNTHNGPSAPLPTPPLAECEPRIELSERMEGARPRQPVW